MNPRTNELRERDLAAAFVALIQGDGEVAVERSSAWQEGWVARSICGLAYSFFLFEPRKGAECLGGIEAIRAREAERPPSIEFLFQKGLGAMLRKEVVEAEVRFRAAAELEPANPYVLLGHAWALLLGFASTPGGRI